METEECLSILRRGALDWNSWRDAHSGEILPSFERVNLERVELDAANLSHMNLREARLSKTTLAHASFAESNLIGADLCGANLDSAFLRGADLRRADLRDANLVHAFLGGVILDDTHLRGADFRRASFGYTSFADCDLSEVRNLALARHEGPSTIGIDTLYKSRGKIPDEFLRGCGVPENLIRYIQSLVNSEEGIQFYSCFISYSSKNEEFARRLHSGLRDARLRVWFAAEDIQGGKKLHEQIETAIRVYDKLLVVLSDASMESEWVMDELRKGFRAEQETGKRKLFPLRLTNYETLLAWKCRDSISGKDLAEEVRQYYIPDFSNWKDHDSFEAALDRLLRDLRTETLETRSAR